MKTWERAHVQASGELGKRYLPDGLGSEPGWGGEINLVHSGFGSLCVQQKRTVCAC